MVRQLGSRSFVVGDFQSPSTKVAKSRFFFLILSLGTDKNSRDVKRQCLNQEMKIRHEKKIVKKK